MRPIAAFWLVAGLALGACSNPLDDVERLSDVTLAEDVDAATLVTDDAAADAVEAEVAGGGGFFGRLLGLGQTDEADAAVVTEAAVGPVIEDTSEPVEEPGGTDAIPGDDTMDQAMADEAAAEEPAPRGLFGFLRDNMGREGGAMPAPTGPDAEVIPPGLQLAYGDIATVCGVSARDLGSRIGSEAGFTLHDTAPGAAPRTFYLTGFGDRCARQFTGNLVLFGSAQMHETIRYSSGTRDIGYTETDRAYEEIKARICGVGPGEPCGARLDRLQRRLTFVTVYPRFGSSPQWTEILLFDGEVVAMAAKGV